jgi:AraC-like DNA-binding protein
VGLDCGYINFSAFSRDYRRTFGVSPSRHLGLLSRPGNGDDHSYRGNGAGEMGPQR